MSNGDCAVGSANTAKIEALGKEQEVQRKAVLAVNEKLDKINGWLLATLGAVLVNLLIMIVQLVSRSAAVAG